jgi:hypothetical protein
MRMVRSTHRPTGTPINTPIAAAVAATAEPPVSSQTQTQTTAALTGIARNAPRSATASPASQTASTTTVMRIAEATGIRSSRSGKRYSQSERNVLVPKPAVRFIDQGPCARQPSVVQCRDVEPHRLQVRRVEVRDPQSVRRTPRRETDRPNQLSAPFDPAIVRQAPRVGPLDLLIEPSPAVSRPATALGTRRRSG